MPVLAPKWEGEKVRVVCLLSEEKKQGGDPLDFSPSGLASFSSVGAVSIQARFPSPLHGNPPSLEGGIRDKKKGGTAIHEPD